MFKSILVAIDLDEANSWSRSLSAAEAVANIDQATIVLGTVVTDWQVMPDQWSPAAYREHLDVARARLELIAPSCPKHRCRVVVGTGAVGPGILELAAEVGADLIVLASHRPGLRDYFLGGNATHVVSHAPCSVLVVRD